MAGCALSSSRRRCACGASEPWVVYGDAVLSNKAYPRLAVALSSFALLSIVSFASASHSQAGEHAHRLGHWLVPRAVSDLLVAGCAASSSHGRCACGGFWLRPAAVPCGRLHRCRVRGWARRVAGHALSGLQVRLQRPGARVSLRRGAGARGRGLRRSCAMSGAQLGCENDLARENITCSAVHAG